MQMPEPRHIQHSQLPLLIMISIPDMLSVQWQVARYPLLLC